MPDPTRLRYLNAEKNPAATKLVFVIVSCGITGLVCKSIAGRKQDEN